MNDKKLANALNKLIDVLGDQKITLKGLVLNKPLNFEDKEVKEIKTFSWDRLRNPRIKIIVKKRGEKP